MNAYLCVYRRRVQSTTNRVKTEKAAFNDATLQAFLRCYSADDSYYDWGDDPSFFSAVHRLGDAQRATWGVCRRDVRSTVVRGDFVVFFCGREGSGVPKTWEYYYIGVGTVGVCLSRRDVWTNKEYLQYRHFYNLLAKPSESGMAQHETFHPYHKDWQARAKAPYIVFDPPQSAFNLVSPLLVSTYAGSVPDVWQLECPRVKALHDLVFVERKIARRLRTARTGFGHAKLNLLTHNGIVRSGRPPAALRSCLIDLVNEHPNYA